MAGRCRAGGFGALLLLGALLFLGAEPARAEFLLPLGREVPLHLNRTPVLFVTDAPPPRTDPRARALARLEGGTLRVTLSWDDPTENALAGVSRAAYRKEAIYKKPTERTDLFGDAAAVMFPAAKGARFPGIMMGDPAQEVRIVLWRAGAKTEILRGRGRAAVERLPDDPSISVRHARAGARRVVTFAVRHFDPDLPLAFAVWDGASLDRNGYKWYTPWYRIAR